MTCPDLLPAFPHTAELIVNGHATLHDVDFDTSCGYVSIDEARILWFLALAFPGVWVEIGSHTGFSGAHIAAAGVELFALDPAYHDSAFRARAVENWTRAGVRHRIRDIPGSSRDWLPGLGVTIDGAFVDGDHDAPAPLLDAQLLLPHLAEHAVVVFHDAVGQPVLDAVEWLAEQGFGKLMYESMSRLAICARTDDDLELQP